MRLSECRVLCHATACASSESALPFPALLRLAALAREDPRFALLERETRMISVRGREVPFEQAGPRTPLWALDVGLGQLFAANGVWRLALPCPGAVIPRLLAAELWPGERRFAVAEAVHSMTTRLIALATTARQRAQAMDAALAHLRSNARAPQVWMAAIAFAPLGLEQVSAGFGVSRRGTYTIGDTLVAAGCVNRKTRRGMVILSGQETRRGQAPLSSVRSALPPSPSLAEFDAAMADIDHLLARQTKDNV
jgi:hypothetical protein